MQAPEENPYLSPITEAPLILPSLGDGDPLTDPRGRGWVAIAFLWLFCLSPVAVYLFAHLKGGLSKESTQGFNVFAFACYLGTGIAVCMWTYRCAVNAARLKGRSLDSDPAKAVWSYFVPIYNFYGPIVAMSEIIDVTYLRSPRTKIPFAVKFFWWGCWITFGITGNLGNPSSSLWSGNYWAIISLVAMYVSAAMLTVIILKLGNAQAELKVPVYTPRRNPVRPLRPSALSGIDPGLPQADIPRLPSRPKPEAPLKRASPGPHPNAPLPRRPAGPEA